MVKSDAVDERVGVALGNSAHVASSLDPEEPVVTPGGSPRVLDVPEVNSVLSSISSGQDGVIDVLSGCAAVSDLVNSSLVVLEARDDLEGNRNGTSVVEPLSQLNLITFGDVVGSESNVSNSDLRSVNALSVLSSVGVGHVGLNSSGVPDVLKGVRRKSSVASVIVEITGAVDELLLREGDVSSLSEDVPVGLHGSNGGEGPARSARSLIFDGGDDTEVRPLVVAGNGLELEFLLDFVLIGGRAFLRLHQSLLGELLEGHIGEVVDALSPRVLSHVVISDADQSFAEDFESIVGLGCVGRVIFVVDLLGSKFIEEPFSVDEITVLDIQVDVAECEGYQSR